MTRSRASPVSAMPNALRSTPHLNPTMFGFTRHDGCWNQCFFNAGPEQLQPTIGWQTRRETPLHKRISQLTVSCTHFFTNIKTQLPHKQDMNNTGFSFEPICVHIDHACCVAWGEKQFNDVGQQKNQIETFAVSQRAACNWPPSFPELQLWWFFSVSECCFCFSRKEIHFQFYTLFPNFTNVLFQFVFFCFSRVDGSRITMTSKSSMPPPAYKQKKKGTGDPRQNSEESAEAASKVCAENVTQTNPYLEARKAQAVLPECSRLVTFNRLTIPIHFQSTFFWQFFFILVPRQHLKRNILESCSNFICENTVESSINSEFATGVWRNVGHKDETLAAELSKELSSSHGLHLQMTQFQSIYNMFSTYTNSQIFKQFSARWLLHLGFQEIFA